MLRPTPRRKRVPNALAILGALLLAASALGGLGQTAPNAPEQEIARNDVPSNPQDAGLTTDPEPVVSKTRKFRVNLFLFRH